MGGSNIPHFRYCGPSHSIANPFFISRIPKHPKSTKSCAICAFCLCLITNFPQCCHFHNICCPYWVFVRREGSDGFFVLIIYMFQEPRNIFWITSARCVWPGCGVGGGGHIMLPGPKPQPSGILHQETTTVTSNTALAETMTNLIGMFIVAWDGNAFSVLNAEQLVVSPIVHNINQAQRSRFISQWIQLQQYPRDYWHLPWIRTLTGSL